MDTMKQRIEAMLERRYEEHLEFHNWTEKNMQFYQFRHEFEAELVFGFLSECSDVHKVANGVH